MKELLQSLQDLLQTPQEPLRSLENRFLRLKECFQRREVGVRR